MIYRELFVETDLPQPYSEEELYNRFLDMKNGDVRARNDIIEHNIRLVRQIVIKKFNNTYYDEKELVAIGMMGLIKSVDTFDVSKNIKFSTYAITCIKNEILIFLRKNKRHLGVCSLEETFYSSDDGELEYKDIVADDSIDFITDYENKECYEIIREVVSRLPEKNKQIMSMYFGFDNNKRMTQHEMSKVLGISQSYISRVIKRTVGEIALELQRQGLIEVRKGFCKKNNIK